jgi:hypothetical protein
MIVAVQRAVRDPSATGPARSGATGSRWESL